MMVVHSSLFVVCCLLLIVCCFSFVVCCLLFDVFLFWLFSLFVSLLCVLLLSLFPGFGIDMRIDTHDMVYEIAVFVGMDSVHACRHLSPLS